MNAPQMLSPRRVAPETTALTSYLPVPGFGVLPVQAFVRDGGEPLLVDTGVAGLREEFLEALRSVVAPEEIRWIWITHADFDHIGNLQAVLDLAPRATVVTSFIGLAKLGLHGIQPDRIHLLNHGQRLVVGDRELVAVAPPTFDAPETTALFDPESRVLFSADSFGALLPEPADDASAVNPGALRDGMVTWATVDAPWLTMVDPDRYGDRLAAVAALDPAVILSSHLPPASGMAETLLGHLSAAAAAPAFVGPDQAALEKMMAGA
jgi:glyoxylase-like metal-dependent hydrolase (beta-lactamase superfamily II)